MGREGVPAVPPKLVAAKRATQSDTEIRSSRLENRSIILESLFSILVRSAPQITAGFRPELLNVRSAMCGVAHFAHNAPRTLFTRAAQKGTSAGFRRAGVSVCAPCLPVGFGRRTFLHHRYWCSIVAPIICKSRVLSRRASVIGVAHLIFQRIRILSLKVPRRR